MEKIIKYGFQPINNIRNRGQNDIKGKKLNESGHVFDVAEKKLLNGLATITADVVAQTSVSKTYNVKITLDDQRNTSDAVCTCKAGLAGKCKHICAVVYYVNSSDSADSKTNHGQEWGKPSRRQLLEYDKGVKMSELFTAPPYTDKVPELVSVKLEWLVFPEDMSECPLRTMINIDKRPDSEIIAAESLVALVNEIDKCEVKRKVNKVIQEVLQLQLLNDIYSQENFVASDVYEFYLQEVSCDNEKAINICIETILQSKMDEWYKQRMFRITASNAHKLKGDRFDIEKAITNLLTPSKVETQAMAYGKKMESVALKEYKKLNEQNVEIVQVGLVVNINQPWLCCSPDAILIYGSAVWQKKLVEIKCPYTCKKIPIYDAENGKLNVQYLKLDENGLRLSATHSIYTQIQLQIYVTNIAVCDLFVYSPQGCVLITIGRDDNFLREVVPKLEKFYFVHYVQRVFIKYSKSK